jgi:hypothetical protein
VEVREGMELPFESLGSIKGTESGWADFCTTPFFFLGLILLSIRIFFIIPFLLTDFMQMKNNKAFDLS